MTDGYVNVAAVEDVPKGGTLAVKVGNEDVVLFESEGSYYAMEDRCPHFGVPLSEGEVEGSVVRCWYHGWEFDLKSGCCLTYEDFPATSYDVLVEDGRIWVRLSSSAG